MDDTAACGVSQSGAMEHELNHCYTLLQNTEEMDLLSSPDATERTIEKWNRVTSLKDRRVDKGEDGTQVG